MPSIKTPVGAWLMIAASSGALALELSTAEAKSDDAKRSKTPLMPWKPCWQVPIFSFCSVTASSLAAGLSVHMSVGAKRRFGHFFRGDISAFFAESWRLSLPLVLVSAVSLFLCCQFRHPLRTTSANLQHWNLAAQILSALASLGLAGVGIFTQKDYTYTSNYPLQGDLVHGIFMCCMAGSFFLYMCLHTFALWHDIQQGILLGGLMCALAVVQSALSVSAIMHFVLWQIESYREEYPDDPKCNKRSEWLCALCAACYLLTLPILTQRASKEQMLLQVSAWLLLILIGLVACCALFRFRVLDVPAPVEASKIN